MRQKPRPAKPAPSPLPQADQARLEESLRARLAEQPGNGAAWQQLAALLAGRGRHAEAADAFAKALANGVPNIERVDRLVQTIARTKGMQLDELDKTVTLVDGWVAKNRAKAA